MPATNTIPKSRERLKAILETVTGLSASRIVLGVVDQSDSNTFFESIVSSGPFVVVGPADIGDRNLQTEMFDYEIPVRLWYGYANNANYDYVVVEDLISEVLKKLGDSSLYITGGLPFSGIAISRDDEASLSPRVILYTLTLRYSGAD